MFAPAWPLCLWLLNVAFALKLQAFDAATNPADNPNRTPSPPITRPRGGDRWNTLEVQTVKWDTTGLDVTGLNGTVLLGYVAPNTTKHIYQDQPLAQNFALSDEAVNIILPDIPTGNEIYFVILLGDMNNTSPLFSIFNSSDTDGLTKISPPATLPPQTMTTQSATITDTNVVSTIGGQTTSARSDSSFTSPTSSPTQTSNGAVGRLAGSFMGVSIVIIVAAATYVI
ncbi:hypothetical protein PYCCODRAFT_1456299 [Trametes coccinea BRFM310]|uniref:Uncharacterized protein n=1 Tax=Trametes coccinea (strain BRFM310) TaxID=1353009 RepID=A0A1Y2J277_TRAC3|nr:hypothetical protein PYCCODRAFT_1456299 [Trametes coccinea BRFM310]